MIQNELEYRVAREKLKKLAESLETARARPNPRQPKAIRQAGLNGIRFLMEDLEAEIAEYEKLHVEATSTVSVPASFP
jgi:hypothetical protein